MKVDLMYPNKAVDQFGNIGTWTMVYNQVYATSQNTYEWYNTPFKRSGAHRM